MQDITRFFEKWCESKGLEYHYGQKQNLNLLNELEPDVIYFLHNENRRKTVTNQKFGNVTGRTFEGNFFIVVESDFDMPFYKEKMQDNGENKYEKNIEPLLKYIDDFESMFFCSDLNLVSLETIDITDLLDFNADGLFVSYVISI